MPCKNRVYLYICVSIAIVAGIFYLYKIFKLNSYESADQRVYIGIAKSIAENKGYKNIYEQYNWQFPAPYPPLYPLILALTYKISPAFHKTIIVFHFLIYLVTVVLVFVIFQILFTKSIFSFTLTILHTINHMVLHYFFSAPIEGFLILLYLLSLLCYYVHIKTNKEKYFYFLLILGAITPYTKASGLSISLSIITFTLLYTKNLKKFLASTLILLPIASFFFYWWLFTGTPGRYISHGFFFTTGEFSLLKLNISEVIFYTPFKLLFYYTGIDYLNNIFYKPLLFIGRTTRFDLAGLISIFLWILVVKNVISMIKSKEYMTFLIFFYSILIFVIHTCTNCADVRLLMIFIPLFLYYFTLEIEKVKNIFTKYFLLSGFIILYLYTNITYLLYS